MILRVPVIVGNAADWARRVAAAVNQLIAAQDTTASGPYADDAAAGEGGIGVGGLYRRPDGTVWWRQAP